MFAVTGIYKLNKITDDPRFEGFALNPLPSLLGRDSLEDDLIPGLDAEETIEWVQPALSTCWKPPSVIGRVSDFNDYPCINMIIPAFSARAVDALREELEENGEILPLLSTTETTYFFYNIQTIAKVLDHQNSVCEFWCDPPTTATDIEYFWFNGEMVQGLSIFRIPEMPTAVFVTNPFLDRVESLGLKGFDFKKVWPLPRGVNWRLQRDESDLPRKELKRNTLVLRIPLEGTPDERNPILALEQVLDSRLLPDSLEDRYIGSYEGFECVTGEYRLFFSCPDAEKLLRYIEEDVRNLEWRRPVIVCLRFGGMHEANVREVISEIK